MQALLTFFLLLTAPAGAELRALTPDEPEGAALIEELRGGGHVLFFRHADTAGMPCDSGYVIGEREGQRNISQDGRAQSAAIGEAIADLGIPIDLPVLASPVFRARDTAEFAFGADNVEIVDGLTADDYAGGRLTFILDEHRRLFNTEPPAGSNIALFGHRTPAIMVLGSAVAGDAFPEGAALVLDPGDDAPELRGILHLAPIEDGGFHNC